MANQEATFSAAGSETQQQALPSSAPTPTTITLASPEDEVKAVMSNLGFLSGAKLTEDLAGVDGEMLLQMTTPATCKELLPSINPRQSVLLAAKIRAWATGRTAAAHAEAVRSAPRSPQQTNEGRGRPLAIDDTRRSRSRSRTPRRNQPSSGSADHTGTGQSMLRNFVAQILTAGEDEDNEQADEQIANKLEELKQIAGPINPESLPPKQVMKRILSLKRKGKGGAPPEYVELKKFLPAVAGPAGGQDQGAINSMSMMAMGLAYVLSGHWNLGNMLTYVGTVTKIAACDGWQTAINYDTMARKRWAAQVLTDDRRQATLDGFLDLHVLDQARTLVPISRDGPA
ncbi:hypothetical protein FOZ60_003809 [Perkinsus olseni]|uniref:Uncharacterized protein n=1 Tax=Perkinsus olseni TaxID=32597 RepID=A0A7J6NUQ0_PEROL|nr:hypothetical protein FOZ60_003809 [Perkinsus olseni]